MFEWKFKGDYYGVKPSSVSGYHYKCPYLYLTLKDGTKHKYQMTNNCWTRFRHLMEEKNA